MNLKSMEFNPDAQKDVVLFTDAPPHIKGIRAIKGKTLLILKRRYRKNLVKTSSISFFI
jgi:hypothetical protein